MEGREGERERMDGGEDGEWRMKGKQGQPKGKKRAVPSAKVNSADTVGQRLGLVIFGANC